MSEKYFSELEKMEHVINKNKTYCPCCNLILTKNYSKKHINTQIYKSNVTEFVIYLIDIEKILFQNQITMTLIWKLLTVNIKISLRCNYYITNILEMRPKTQIELTIGKKNINHRAR